MKDMRNISAIFACEELKFPRLISAFFKMVVCNGYVEMF